MDEKIKIFCNKWKITELSLFGSFLTEKFNSQSDIDILIDFKPNHNYGFFELSDMKNELQELYGRDVDLITRSGIEKSKNSIRKNLILNNLKQIYAEG